MSAGETLQQVAQESQKVRTALALCQKDGQSARQRVESSKDGHPPILPGGRDKGLLAQRRPHPTQAGIEMELALILEDEGESLRVEDRFFKPASRPLRALRTAFGSCLCLSESLGLL